MADGITLLIPKGVLNMTLDYYIPPIKASQKFYSDFAKCAEELGFNVRRIDVADANQLTFIRSCAECDVVFVDATVPPNRDTPSVYPCLVPDVNFLDHVFVFSDNRFPLNIVPHNGWSRYDVNDRINTQKPKDVFKKYLERIKDEITTGKHYLRIKVEDNEDVVELMKALADVREKAMDYASKRESSSPQKSDDKTHIFISYRAKKSNGDENYKDVEKFARRKKAEGCEVDYVQSEELSAQSELMSPMRKWFLLNQLADRIICADEFWIYKTDNYLGSWWTIGELILVSYLNRGFSRQNRPIKIKIYNSDTSMETSASGDYYVHDDNFFKRLARYLSYTNPKSMGPESRKILALQKLVYEAAKEDPSILEEIKSVMRDQFDAIRTIDGEKVIPSSMVSEIIDEMSSADKMMDRLEDEVNQDVFWDGLTMQLTEVTKALRNCGEEEEPSPTRVNKLIDYDMFLKLPMLEIVNLDASSIEDFMTKSGKEVALTNKIATADGIPFVKKLLTKAPDRYLWLATRGMIPVEGSFALGLDKVNSFRIS